LASACSVRSKAFLDSGIASLPDPLAVPPPRFLAAGGFGAPRVAGLDADGRLVKYGGGPGSVSDVSVCPGGVTAVETVQNLDGIRDGLALRDLESLDQQATRFLGLRRTGARYETIDDVQCLTRDASRISVFLADTGTGVARLLLLRGQRKDPVWVGRASVATYRGQRVWLDGPAGMRAVHVRSGEERVLGLLPLTGRPLGLSPDGETLAAGVDGTLQLIDTATGAVLGVRRGEPNELAWIDNGRLVTRRKGRTRLLDRRGQVGADDLAPGALTVSDGQLVIIEGDRLARYSRLGIVLSRSQQLFSDGITVLTGLPSRSARIACLNLRRQRWEQH
jgi:hypothetical protein